jgi:hypothetical protein
LCGLVHQWYLTDISLALGGSDPSIGVTHDLGAARRNGVLVMRVQNTAFPNRMSDSPAQIRFNLRMHERRSVPTAET